MELPPVPPHFPPNYLNESRAPNPANFTTPSAISSFATSTALMAGNEISKPSSPVYPHLVIRQHCTPATSPTVEFIKYNCDKSTLLNFCSACAAFGPCSANRARSCGSKKRIFTSALGFLRLCSSCKQFCKYCRRGGLQMLTYKSF